MPIQSAKAFQQIIMHLSVLRYVVTSNSKRGLLDLNKQAEPFFRDLLNKTHAWNMRHMNAIRVNYPAIDLGDADARVCVQVTAENSSSKIQETLNAFAKHKLSVQYDRLVFLILTQKKNYTKVFQTQGGLKFDSERDIWDVDDLLSAIEAKPLPELEALLQYIQAELAPIVKALAPKHSVFALAEGKADTPPVNAALFLNFLGYGPEHPEERQEEFLSIVDAYAKLRSLSREARGFLAVIIANGFVDKDRIVILASELESKTRELPRNGAGYMEVLEHKALAYVYSEEYPRAICARYRLSSGEDFFSRLKEFCNSEAALAAVIEDCDFTILDPP